MNRTEPTTHTSRNHKAPAPVERRAAPVKPAPQHKAETPQNPRFPKGWTGAGTAGKDYKD